MQQAARPTTTSSGFGRRVVKLSQIVGRINEYFRVIHYILCLTCRADLQVAARQRDLADAKSLWFGLKWRRNWVENPSGAAPLAHLVLISLQHGDSSTGCG